jgi:hypothetical protein
MNVFSFFGNQVNKALIDMLHWHDAWPETGFVKMEVTFNHVVNGRVSGCNP